MVVVVAVALVLFGGRARDEGPGAGDGRVAHAADCRAWRCSRQVRCDCACEVGAWMLLSLLLSVLPAVLRTVFGVQRR